jgi:hypothetical protein
MLRRSYSWKNYLIVDERVKNLVGVHQWEEMIGSNEHRQLYSLLHFSDRSPAMLAYPTATSIGEKSGLADSSQPII